MPCVFKPSRQGQQRTPTIPVHSESHPMSSKTCVSCRERHLKCTGGPLCARCAKEGLPCLSKQSRRGQRRPELPVKVIWTNPRNLTHGSLQRSPISSCESTMDRNSLRSFTYFREKTSPELSAHQDQSFWNSLILQISHGQPAIKHLLTAVGSLHEALEVAYSTMCNEDAQPLRVYALKQQGQGIRLLKDSGGLPSEAILISSVLLICFEALQRGFSSMINTLRISFRVLRDCNEQSLIRDEVITVFSRVSLQASTFLEYLPVTRNPWASSLISKDSFPAQTVELPKSFKSFSHAATCLDSIMVQGCTHQDPVICTPNYESVAFHLAKTQAFLRSWYDRLSNFLSQAQQTNTQFLRDSFTMKIKYHVAYVVTSPLQHKGELRFDNYLSNFEAIISLSKQWLDLNSSGEARPEPVRCTIAGGEHTAGIIPGLMLCALHCRCPVLRRQAVSVLTRQDCQQEGTWMSDTAAKVADYMIALEEQGSANPQSRTDIPQVQRVRLLRVCRPTGIFSPYDQPGGPHTDCGGIWHIPRARAEMRFIEQPRQLVLRYVKAPCDVNSCIEEVCLNLQPRLVRH